MNLNHFVKEFSPSFDPIQQRDEAIIYAKKLENELKKLRIENGELMEHINGLEIKNQHKDKLLDEKYKQIINSTSEILRLKQEIEKLKKRILKKFNLSSFNLSNNKRRKRKSAEKMLKRRRNEIESNDIANPHSLSLSSVQSSFDSDFSENTEKTDSDEMPYVLPQISSSISASSNLSAQACKLSLPIIQDSNPPPYINKATTVRVLSPIAENSCTDIDDDDDDDDDDELLTPMADTTTMSPILPISDNNINIHMDEWGDCIASIDSNNDNHHDSQSDNGYNFSFKEQCSIETLSDDQDVISYMSDNTMIFMDICLDLNINNKHLLNNNELDIELSMKSQQIYNDDIIKPPFNLLNNNEAVFV